METIIPMWNGGKKLLLRDILELFPELKLTSWRLKFIRAVSNTSVFGLSMLELEKTVESTPDGVILSPSQILELGAALVDLDEIELVGYQGANAVLTLIADDSSTWSIWSTRGSA